MRCSSHLISRAWDLKQLQVSGGWTQPALRGLVWVLFGPPLSCFSSSLAAPQCEPIGCGSSAVPVLYISDVPCPDPNPVPFTCLP